MSIWTRAPRAVRALLLTAMWFTFGALLSNLNSLDDGGRTAEIIWGAVVIGTAVTVVTDASRSALVEAALRTGTLPDGIDLADWRRRLARSRLVAALAPFFAVPYLGFGALSADSSRSPYRVFLLGMFGLFAMWVIAAAYKRSTRIRALQAVLRQHQHRQSPVAAAPEMPIVSREEQRWRSHADTPKVGRFITTGVMTTAMAFFVLLVADLDSVVYSDSRGSHLGWVTLVAAITGVALTAMVFGDPRLRATGTTIDEILLYDRAWRTGELPARLDIDQWRRWITSHHRSDGAILLWSGFFATVSGWAIVTHPPGYHWVVAVLLAVPAIWQFRRWRRLCAMNARLKSLVQRHAIGQLYG